MKNIHQDRICQLSDERFAPSGRYILYWMSQSYRTHWNYALEYAVGLAEQTDSKVLVLAHLSPFQAHYTQRHLLFLLEGLAEVKADLSARKIKFILRVEPLEQSIGELTQQAYALVTDFPYLDEDRDRLEQALQCAHCPAVQIEGNLAVPVEAVTDHREYAARTLRPKIEDAYRAYLDKPVSSQVETSSLNMSLESLDPRDPEEVLSPITFETEADPVPAHHTGGLSQAKQRLDDFLRHRLDKYDEQRQSPTNPVVSQLSMYLAMGMIAPAYILKRLDAYLPDENAQSFREELLVRRELAYNFVYFSDTYDELSALPDWAQETLENHRSDDRPYRYTRREMEQAKTHDEAWNECMRRMKERGYLHNYMRMYWGKRILAWCNTPEYAHRTLLYLNNKYFLDGKDPNSYANTLWIFGLHDRVWKERAVFGKVRTMNRRGLERKIDIDSWTD